MECFANQTSFEFRSEKCADISFSDMQDAAFKLAFRQVKDRTHTFGNFSYKFSRVTDSGDIICNHVAHCSICEKEILLEARTNHTMASYKVSGLGYLGECIEMDKNQRKINNGMIEAKPMDMAEYDIIYLKRTILPLLNLILND